MSRSWRRYYWEILEDETLEVSDLEELVSSLEELIRQRDE